MNIRMTLGAAVLVAVTALATTAVLSQEQPSTQSNVQDRPAPEQDMPFSPEMLEK